MADGQVEDHGIMSNSDGIDINNVPMTADDEDGNHDNGVVNGNGTHTDACGEGCVIPYSAVHRKPRSLKSVKQEVWIPGVPINVSVVEAIRQPTTDIFNPNIYVVQLEHGGYKWEIRRRYKHFQSLHTHLMLYKANVVLGSIAKMGAQERRPATEDSLPNFPKQIDRVVSPNKIEERKMQLQTYLQGALASQLYRNHPHTLEFLEVSHLSFIHELGSKLKEGFLRKRGGGHRTDMCLNMRAIPGQWQERWFVVKDSYVAYIRPDDGNVCHVQLMDNEFSVLDGKSQTGVKGGLKICSLSRELLVQCWTKRKMKEWCADIKHAMETSGKDFIQTNRFGSFAPVRPESWCRWFVDGAGYFDAVASAIAEAKEEIFITDWWLSPEIYLKRPATQCGRWRLDLLLKRKADEGVELGGRAARCDNFQMLSSQRQRKRTKAGTRCLHKDSRKKRLPVQGRWRRTIPRMERVQPPSLPKAFTVDSSGKRLWVGKDYSNFIFKDITDLNVPFSDLIDRKTTPRMPWHDIGSCVYGAPARDLARHFVQRWNHAKTEKAKFEEHFPLLLPKSYDNITVPPEVQNQAIKCQVQALRSVSDWSIGIERTEDSIHQAYLTAIREAKYFIYIENQFFITQMDSTVVINGIAQALFDRIRQAHEAGENFRVYVVMPLLPGFEGEVGAPSGYAIQAVTHWQYASISRGGNSLLEKLGAAGIPAQKYITFHGMRTHDELDDKPVSELIYIHSKMLIVDDRLCIIGSANINERSMRGSRDSETAAIFEDTEFVPCTFDGKDGQRGLFVGSLRTQVFRELLGLMDDENGNQIVGDPVTDEFYKNLWIRTTSINTDVYDQVFNCIPTDLVRTFEQLADYKEKAKRHLAITDVDAAREQLLRVKGYLVFLPLHFLADVDMRPPATTKEGLVPDMLWT
ncbi:PREDICTED: phospholipase D1-like [Priapulus caudatus]|uniref:Phospholipase n=1 Tax=Priapulus caudatus TaxID=37621 RepID=A0ABM1EW17_PRICU|nr:PREDICTED: phospholipase D1-like [Priapulus caudatus]